MVVQTTITLESELYTKLEQLTLSRDISQFISEVLREKIQWLERKKIESQMKEGYLATKSDRAQLNDDWEVVGIEGW